MNNFLEWGTSTSRRSATSTVRRSTTRRRPPLGEDVHATIASCSNRRNRRGPHRHAGSLALPTAIDALNAGKDVYVEKPLTLKIEEGPAIVKAARVNNRICQVGMQQRSGKHYLQAKAGIYRYRQARQDHAGAHLVARQHATTCGERRRRCKTQPSNLDWAQLPRPAEVARLRSAAVLQLARLSRFRRRPGHRLFTHWIDVVHMFMGRTSRFRPSAAGGVYTTRTAARRPTRSTCCWNIRRNSLRRSRRRWRPASGATASRSAEPKAVCGYARQV